MLVVTALDANNPYDGDAGSSDGEVWRLPPRLISKRTCGETQRYRRLNLAPATRDLEPQPFLSIALHFGRGHELCFDDYGSAVIRSYQDVRVQATAT